jgi:hypothetical protein
MPRAQPEISEDEIARRAYEISQSAECGSDEDNWHRAQRELRETINGTGASPRGRRRPRANEGAPVSTADRAARAAVQTRVAASAASVPGLSTGK